jgi:hypothetical protein
VNTAPDPEVQAAETIGGVLTDLVEISERLPVPGGQAEAVARILERLGEEITEAAVMLHGGRSGLPPVHVPAEALALLRVLYDALRRGESDLARRALALAVEGDVREPAELAAIADWTRTGLDGVDRS